MDHRDKLAEKLFIAMNSNDFLYLETGVRQDVSPQGEKVPRDSFDMRYKYYQNSNHQRFLECVYINDGKVVSREEDYGDKSKFASVKFDKHDPFKQDTIIISRSFKNEDKFGYTDRPEPLRYYYVGLTPLHQALARASDRGEREVSGRRCAVFEFTEVRSKSDKTTMLYYLDLTSGFPLRVESYKSKADLDDDIKSWEWEGFDYRTTAGVTLPRRSLYKAYAGPAVGKSSGRPVAVEREIVIQDLGFSRRNEIKAWPDVASGVKVLDGIKNVAYTSGQDDAAVTQHVANPVRAGDPDPGWGVPASWIFLLGVVLLVVGIVGWRRGK